MICTVSGALTTARRQSWFHFIQGWRKKNAGGAYVSGIFMPLKARPGLDYRTK
jgi:hypothetical protein